MLRIDSTVTDSPIHAPSDSTLLWDSVRVPLRLLARAEELAGGVTAIEYRNHRRLAKRRMRAICYTRGARKRARLYRDLIGVTRKTLGYAEEAQRQLHAVAPFEPLACELWHLQLNHYKSLILKVIDQAKCRVLENEQGIRIGL